MDNVLRFAENASFLVVENEPMIAMMIEMMLEDAGARTVFIAGSVSEAISLISASIFDVCIFDVIAHAGGTRTGQATANLPSTRARIASQ